jgi:hypothetical protein
LKLFLIDLFYYNTEIFSPLFSSLIEAPRRIAPYISRRYPLAKTGKSLAWHPAFVQAFQLELEQYKDVLEFIPELQLTSEPLRIDLAVIKKLKNIPIEKNIAAIFRSENLLEYKSPDDHVSIADFYKVYGYACLYASLNAVPITGITISFVESRKPKKLLKHLREVRNYRVEEKSAGIYVVEGDIIPIQIIDSRELSAGENLWLKGLSRDLEIGAAVSILEAGRGKAKERTLGAYMEVILNANARTFMEAGKMRNKRNKDLTFDDVLVELGLAAKWKAEVMEEVQEESREEDVRNLLKYGMDAGKVAEALNIPLETVMKIQQGTASTINR